MKKSIFALVMATTIAVTGCASNKAQQEAYYKSMLEQRKELIKAKLASASKSLCKLECPPDGCKVQAFECNAPDDITVPNIQAPVSDAKYWSDALVKSFAIAAPVYLGVAGFNSIKDTAIGLGNSLGSPSYTYTNSYNEGSLLGEGVLGSGQIGNNVGNNYGSGQLGDYTGNNLGDGMLGDGQFGDTDNSDNSDNRTNYSNSTTTP